VSSVLWGIAPILQALIFIRVLQGTIGGGLQPLSQAVWLEEFFPEQCGEAMVFWELEVTWGSPRTKVVGNDSGAFWTRFRGLVTPA
jgi:DHA2 family multidrug resistance protein